MSPVPRPDRDPAECIRAGEATVAVVGLGYVGLPVAWAFLSSGLRVIGFDNDPSKIEQISAGEGYFRHIPDRAWEELAGSDRFLGTTDPASFREADAILLCVPTPLGDEREPDLSFVRSSAACVAEHIHPGALVILESTSYPGTTRDVLLPIFEAHGHTLGAGLHVAYSPEREDPGRTDLSPIEVPKLVGGLDRESGELAVDLYRAAYQQVVPVSTSEVAEAAKILENVYRAVNIALVNELKLILEKMDIDIWEVVEAAETKPYGFQAFRPGPGLGGHCIPIDPFYLTWKAEQVGSPTRFIELAGEINTAMPVHVVDRVCHALAVDGVSPDGARILVLGIAYKPGVDDCRETPAGPIIAALLDRGARVEYHDPFVADFPPMRRYAFELSSVSLTTDRLRASDCVVVVTDHATIDWDRVAEHAPRIVDTRNVLSGRHIRGRLWKA